MSQGGRSSCCEHVDPPCCHLRQKVGERQTACVSAQHHPAPVKSARKRMAAKERKGHKRRRSTEVRPTTRQGRPVALRDGGRDRRTASSFAPFAFFCGHPPRWSGQLNHLHSRSFALPIGSCVVRVTIWRMPPRSPNNRNGCPRTVSALHSPASGPPTGEPRSHLRCPHA